MSREEKEEFIAEMWKVFEEPEDTIDLPDLSIMTDKSIDTMVMWFNYCLENDERTNK